MSWISWVIVGLVLVGFFLLPRLSWVSAPKARQLLQQGAFVVDVRSPGEFQGAHLPGALNIPMAELSQEMGRQVPDKDQILLLHCLSGTRSGMARRQLQRLGYRHVFNLGSYGRAERIVGEARPK